VVSAEQFATVVPAKAITVAQSIGEDLTGRVFGRRIQSPQAGRICQFAAFIIVGIVSRFIAVGAGAAADVEQTIGSEGDMADTMIKRADAPGIAGLKPRFGARRS